jgi:RimJ/RimL family protein N-acetyltransferase
MTSRIRAAEPSDAAAYRELCHRIQLDHPFSLFAEGEQDHEHDAEGVFLTRHLAQDNNALFFWEEDGAGLVGYVAAYGGSYACDHHSALVILEIEAAWRRRGIGTALLRHLIAWARAKGMARLELTCLAENTPALGLYEKCGFVREGLKRGTRRKGEVLLNEWMMAVYL